MGARLSDPIPVNWSDPLWAFQLSESGDSHGPVHPPATRHAVRATRKAQGRTATTQAAGTRAYRRCDHPKRGSLRSLCRTARAVPRVADRAIKNPSRLPGWGFWIGAWRCPTLAWGDPTLPSAMTRFTAEFGMGSGGSTSLWSPGKRVCLEGKSGGSVTASRLYIRSVFARVRLFGLYGQAARAISMG